MRLKKRERERERERGVRLVVCVRNGRRNMN